LLGALVGLVQVAVFTWIQKRVPPQMMGRIMSIFMFIMFGLAPLSSAGTGWIMQHATLPQMFFGSGLVLIVCATLALLLTPMRRIATA
jgi:MFS family permease